MMKIACAWCGKVMGEKDSKIKGGVSHGICKECLAKTQAKKRIKPRDEDETAKATN